MEILHARVGDRVRVRQRTWTVQDIDSYERCRVFTLASGGQTDGPRTCRLLHPFDDIDPVPSARRVRRVPLRGWRRSCRALLGQAGDATSVGAAAAAGIELLPYQLEPTLALLLGRGARLLIADEVGLGKTVQALLAAAELLRRGVVSRLLVLCPAGLREQWADESAARFDVPLAILDQTGVRRARARLPPGVNPWTVEPCVVASFDYVKRAEVLPAVLQAPWDMVIVDEAHGVCGDSDRRDAASQLCARAPYVALLSATPHNGDEDAFATLCALGRHDDELVVFRRSRLEAGRDAGRRAHTLRVHPGTLERRMHAALAALTRAVRRESVSLDRHVWLLLTLLHKRALSSPFALAASVERRLQLLGASVDGSTRQLLLPLDDDGGELDGADAAPMWSAPALRDCGRERQLLERLLAAARNATGTDAKLRRLRRLLDRVHEPVIVFTEYRDTLLHVRAEVAPHAVVVHGGLTREQRRAALDAFPAVGVLLATDAAGEGLNLQRQCRAVINLELPWNPMRLEQRIGRVDRIGQRQRVHVVHLVSEGSGETRLLDRLSGRLAQARTRVGAPDPLCGRPEWTEDSSARFVVFGDDTPEVVPRAAPLVPLTRLIVEGEREANRIALIRTTQPARERAVSADHAATFVSRARKPRTRAALGGRTLAILRSVVLDAGGRIVAAQVSGLLCPPAMPLDAATLAQPLEADREAWSEEVRAAHVRMTTVRLHRARRIAALFARTADEQQPGLFDRRVEQQAHADTELARVALAAADECAARAESSLALTTSAPELALVLLPGAPGALE